MSGLPRSAGACSEADNRGTIPAMQQTPPPPVHFRQLSELLQHYGELWRPIPFYLPVLPWESTHPSLAAALAALSEEDAATLEADQHALVAWLADHIPHISRITDLDSVAPLASQPGDYPMGFERGIPGGKWLQVTAFAGCLEQLNGTVLEWCAGKAHLGRALYQRFQTPVIALEKNSKLCSDGENLSRQLGTDVRMIPCDVLSPQLAACMPETDHAVALHACGDLHRRLIEIVTTQGIHSLALSPCCYHLTTDAGYRPYSMAARDSGLVLSRDDCRLAVQETVTAAAAGVRRRRKKSAWRLGFDALQRELRRADEYMPVPPLNDACFGNGFATFCRQVAGLKGVQLPEAVDWQHYENLGWEREARMRRMELPRHAFRRALELWLVLDRALHLAECGYRVSVGTFCDRRVTPRNLMIQAARQRGVAA